MKPTPNKKTVKEFAEEFSLRKRFTPSMRYLEVKKVKDLRAAMRIMSN